MTTVAIPVWTCRLGSDDSFSPLAAAAKMAFGEDTELNMDFDRQSRVHHAHSEWTDWQDCQLIRTYNGRETPVDASVRLRMILSRSAPSLSRGASDTLSTIDGVAKVRVARPPGLSAGRHSHHPPVWTSILDEITRYSTLTHANRIMQYVLGEQDIPLSTDPDAIPSDTIPFETIWSNGQRKSILDVDREKVESFGWKVGAGAILHDMTDIESGSIPITLSDLEVQYPTAHVDLANLGQAIDLKSWKTRDLTLYYKLEVKLKSSMEHSSVQTCE